MFSARWFFSTLMIAALFSAGCTRSKSDSSKIQVMVPAKMASLKAGAQAIGADDILGHVAINVSGDGMSPIVFNWDVCRECENPTVPPGFVLDIPTGNRLIQVLAVYMNKSNGSMTFYYGDAAKTLAASQETVAVPISQLGSSMDIVSGSVVGRYLTASNQGPTGPVDILYIPEGKPPLILDRGFIANGWFSLFGLTGVALGYRLPDGNLLFGKSLDLNDPVFQASDKVLKVAVPAHFRKEERNGVVTWDSEEASLQISGFFGPGVDASSKVCKPSALPDLTRKASNSSGSTLLSGSSSAIPSPSSLINTANPLPSYYVNGGDNSSATCSPLPAATSSQRNVSFMQFYPAQIDFGGREGGFMGYHVPLQYNANGSPLTISGDPRVIAGQVLPGIETLMDSFAFFKRPTPNYDFHLEQVDCNAIINGAYGFVPAGNASLDANRSFSITTNMTQSETNSGMTGVLCPVKSGIVLSRGIFLRTDHLSGGGGGGGGGPGPAPAKIKVQLGANVTANLHENSCVPVTMSLLAADDTPAYPGANGQSINVTLSNTTMYTSEHCTPSQALSSPINMWGSQQHFFIRIGTSNGSVSVSSSGLIGVNSGTTTETVSFTRAAPADGTQLKMLDPRNNFIALGSLNQYECREVFFQLQDSSGVPATLAGSTNFVITNGILGGIQMYQDPMCTMATAGPSFGSLYENGITYQPTQIRTFVKRTTSGSASIATTLNGGAVSFSQTITTNTFSNPTALKLQIGKMLWNGSTQNVPTGICLPVLVQSGLPTNMQFNVAAPNETRTINVSYSLANVGPTVTAGFYTDSSCSASPAGTVTVSLSPSMAEGLVYFKVSGFTGAPSLNFSATDSTASPPGGPLAMASYQNIGVENLTYEMEVRTGGGGGLTNWGTSLDCREMVIRLRSSNGNYFELASGSSITINSTNAYQYYSSYASGCANPMNGGTPSTSQSIFFTGGHQFSVWFQYANTNGSMDDTFMENFTTSGHPGITGTSISYSQGIYLSLYDSSPAAYHPDWGSPYYLKAKAINGTPLVPGNLGFSGLSLNYSGFLTDPQFLHSDCTNSVSFLQFTGGVAEFCLAAGTLTSPASVSINKAAVSGGLMSSDIMLGAGASIPINP